MRDTTPREQGLLDQFSARAREFWRLWGLLDSERDVAVQMGAGREYDALMKRGVVIKTTVNRLTRAIDAGVGAYRYAVDKTSRGIENVVDFYRDNIGWGLGAIPLIPVAVVGVASAAIVKWTSEAVILSRRIALYKTMRADGVSAGAAAKRVNQIVKSPGFFTLNTPSVIPIVVALGVAFVLYKKGKL